MGDRSGGGWRSGMLGLVLAAGVGLAAPGLAMEETPVPGRPGPGASPAPEDGPRRRGGERCPSVSSLDPGFFPIAPGPAGEAIDPGFAPRPDPAARRPGEEIDPGFFVPFPPCAEADATPAAGARQPDR